jgi:type II secretion system protein J
MITSERKQHGFHRSTPGIRHSKSSGFTLIEVILAIAILAAMILLNYRILRGIIQAKQLIDDRRDGMYIANSVLTRLARELQQAVSKPLMPSCQSLTSAGAQGGAQNPGAPNSGVTPKFLGETGMDGTSLTFMASEAGQYIPGGGGSRSGIVQINYRVAKDPDARNSNEAPLLLVRTETPSMPLIRACKNVLTFPITSNLVSLEFKFYDAQSKEWSDSWMAQKSVKVPDIIQFSVRLRSPAGNEQSYTSAVKVHS